MARADTKQIGIRVDLATYRALEEMVRKGGHRSVTALAESLVEAVVADDLAAHQPPSPEKRSDG